MSIETTPPKPADATDWDVHSHQDKELVKGLGLTSATMLVMGSMIGSGIFIVSAEIGREVDSPALLIGAWLVTGSGWASRPITLSNSLRLTRPVRTIWRSVRSSRPGARRIPTP